MPEGFEAEQPDVDSADGVDVEDIDLDDTEGDDWEDDGSDDTDFDVDADDTTDRLDDAVKRFKVKVNGEEVEVDEDELLAGYQRQADYTRKTQELSQRAKQVESVEALAQLLTKNPQGTILALAEKYGVEFQGGQREQSKAGDDWDSWDDDGSSPTSEDPKIAQLEARLAEMENERAMAKLDKDLSVLEAQYGDFDRESLIAFAASHEIYDLETAYKAWDYEKVKERIAKEAKNVDRVQKKRQVKKVSPGAARNRGSSTKAPAKPKSVIEAFALAKQELGEA